ncbi:MAG: nodulation protein NoeA, partial [Marinilabiliales bacterium]
DGIIALAFLHHLVFGRNVPLQDVVTWLVKLAPQGVIEFVPKSDPMIKQLLRFRDDIFSDYSEAAFVKFLSNHSKIIESKVVTESGRKLFWFHREVN